MCPGNVTLDAAFPKKALSFTLQARVVEVEFENTAGTLHHAEPNLIRVGGTTSPSLFGGAHSAGKSGIWHDSSAGNEALPCLKPEWQRGRKESHPAVFSCGSTVAVRVRIRYDKVPSGLAALGYIKGVCASPYLCFDAVYGATGPTTLPPKDGDVIDYHVQATSPLPAHVDLVDAAKIDWSVEVGNEVGAIGSSGPHTVYATLAAPRGGASVAMCSCGAATFDDADHQTITDSRVDFAVRAVRAAKVSTDKACVDQAFAFLRNSNVHYSVGHRWEPDGSDSNVRQPTNPTVYPALHHYLWLCLAGQAEAECHNLAAAFRLMCHILGVQGTMPIGHMHPWPRRAEASPTYPPRGDQLKGRLCSPCIRYSAAGVPVNQPLLFIDGNGARNSFEGVAVYDGGLYAIGEQIFDRHTTAADGYSAADWNASDFYTHHDGSGLRPSSYDDTRGSMHLYFGDAATGDGAPFQYPTNLWPPNGPNRPSNILVLDDGTTIFLTHEVFRWQA